MKTADPNRTSLESTVAALGDVHREMVLVGGCSVGLLISDPASPPVRETIDVDLVADVAHIHAWYQLRDKLEARGFTQSAQAEHMCRWVKGPLKLDVMPSEDVLHHSTNRWYPAVVATAHEAVLSNGVTVRVVSPPLFLATKLEAFHDRGEGDYVTSHDLEDIINVVDGRPELVDEVNAAPDEIRLYLREQFDDLLADMRFVDAIPLHLRSDAASQARGTLILTRLRKLAGL